MPQPRTISHAMPDDSFRRQLAALFDEPRLSVRLTVGGSGGTRGVTIQVINRLKQDWEGQRALRLWVATAADGGPGGTQTLGAPTAGSVLRTLAADQDLELLTSAAGTVELELSASAPATRYLRVQVGDDLKTSAAIVWT